MRKIILSALVAFMLVGCSNTKPEEINPNKIFSEDINRALNIENTSKKVLMSDMSNDEIVNIVTDMMNNEHLRKLSVNYGSESEGIGTNDKGEKIFCHKIPVTFSLDGGESSVHEFVEELDAIPSKIAVSKFDIINKDEEFHVDAIVNFLGNMDSTSISSSKSSNVKKNAINVDEEEKVVLRDFDFNLTIRPSNSDSSAVMLGVKNSRNCLYSDDNIDHDVVVNFSSKNGKVYAEYSIDGEDSRTESFTPNGEIKFDILSCERVLNDDYIDVNLTINNSSDKKVSVVIYDDEDSRVKVKSKSDNVDVLNK